MGVKVAVYGNTSAGKSTLSVLLGTVFSISHQRQVVIFTTKPSEYKEMVNITTPRSTINSVSVFRALLESSELSSDTEVFDYAERIGLTNTFLFDFLSEDEDSDLEETFVKTMNKIKSDLTIVDVDTDTREEFKEILRRECNVFLYLFEHTHKGMKGVKEYIKRHTSEDGIESGVLRRTIFVCNKYNKDVTNEKFIAAAIGRPVRQIILVPNIPLLQKESLNGELETTAPYIIKGQYQLVPLRLKLKEVMSVILDSPKVKVVQEVGKWHS